MTEIKRKVKYRAGGISSGGFATSLHGTQAEHDRFSGSRIEKHHKTRVAYPLKIYQVDIFKLFSVHICQLFAQLRKITTICHLSLQKRQVGLSKLPPLLQYSCHEVCRLCHLKATGQVATGTARIT